MKTELKSQFQLVSLRLLIRMTNCLQIYLKNCDFYVKMTYFWGSGFGQIDRRFGRTVRFGRSLVQSLVRLHRERCLLAYLDKKQGNIAIGQKLLWTFNKRSCLMFALYLLQIPYLNILESWRKVLRSLFCSMVFIKRHFPFVDPSLEHSFKGRTWRTNPCSTYEAKSSQL